MMNIIFRPALIHFALGRQLMVTLTLNGKEVQFDGDPSMPLLWFIRDVEGLTGTKFGCGVAQCGACTVHVNSEPRRSCVTPVGTLDGADVTTIEGLQDKVTKAVRAAWVAIDVPQCGYCQSGQIMSAVGLLSQNPKPTDDDIDLAMNGNICRCCTYHRIRAAIHDASSRLEG
jgi:isoquinoline 1-oxidoreductase alpha subunit